MQKDIKNIQHADDEKVMAAHLNKRESPSTKEALHY